MVFRFLIRFLTNNEHLVQRLSESYPVRRAAQLVVRFFNHGKYLAEEKGLNEKITPEQFRKLIHEFTARAQQGYLKAQERIKKRKF